MRAGSLPKPWRFRLALVGGILSGNSISHVLETFREMLDERAKIHREDLRSGRKRRFTRYHKQRLQSSFLTWIPECSDAGYSRVDVPRCSAQ